MPIERIFAGLKETGFLEKLGERMADELTKHFEEQFRVAAKNEVENIYYKLTQLDDLDLLLLRFKGDICKDYKCKYITTDKVINMASIARIERAENRRTIRELLTVLGALLAGIAAVVSLILSLISMWRTNRQSKVIAMSLSLLKKARQEL